MSIMKLRDHEVSRVLGLSASGLRAHSLGLGASEF